MPTSPTSLNCKLGEYECGIDLIDLHTIPFDDKRTYLDEYGDLNVTRSFSHDENERAELKKRMDRVKAEGFALLRAQLDHSKGPTMTLSDSDRAAITTVERLAPNMDSIRADWRTKGSAYLEALAQSLTENEAKQSRFATDHRSCGCGGNKPQNLDGDREYQARQKMLADSRDAHMQPTSMTLDSAATSDKPAAPAPNIDGEDREAKARAAMMQASREAGRTPIGTEGK
jgi:hypothetical protein